MKSKQCMLDGIACLERGDWHHALAHFDQALILRKREGRDGDLESLWLLAAAWINRGDALRFLGKLQDAVDSLDRAIEVMDYLPLEQNQAYVNRLLLVWSNRALVCSEMERMEDAVYCYTMTDALLNQWGRDASLDRKMIVSMIYVNRSQYMLDCDRVADAWKGSQEAIEILSDLPDTPEVKEALIKAKAVLCRSLAMLLDDSQGMQLENDWIARATEVCESALLDVRASGYRGAWITDFIRYGARIYRVCKPQMLGEYLSRYFSEVDLFAKDKHLRMDVLKELSLAKESLKQLVYERLHDAEYIERVKCDILSLHYVESDLILLQ